MFLAQAVFHQQVIHKENIHSKFYIDATRHVRQQYSDNHLKGGKHLSFPKLVFVLTSENKHSHYVCAHLIWRGKLII